MNVSPGFQIGWAVVHVEAIWHTSAEFSHEERIGQSRGERNCCLECGGWKAPATQSDAGYGCRCRPNDIDRHNRVAFLVVLQVFGEAVDHYRLPHVKLLSPYFETRTSRPQVRLGESVRMETAPEDLDSQ